MTKKKKVLNQAERVKNYLLRKGKKGATNFEMMVALRICDVRKRICDINNMVGLDFSIESDYEQSPDGKVYKRYWAVPAEYWGKLKEYLDENKYSRKVKTKRTGGGKR